MLGVGFAVDGLGVTAGGSDASSQTCRGFMSSTETECKTPQLVGRTWKTSVPLKLGFALQITSFTLWVVLFATLKAAFDSLVFDLIVRP